MMPDSFSAATPEAGRFDVMLSRVAGVSRVLARLWLEGGAAKINGVVVLKGSYALKGTETLEWTPPPPLPSEILPENIPLTVLFEDEFIIAVDKPAGMLTHPAAHVHSGTLVNALLGRNTPLALEGEDFGVEGYRPGIVHRLDQDTSGVIIVAKTREAHSKLAKAFADRRTKKHYLAITVGIPESITLDASIGRHPHIKTRMGVGGTNAKDAKTDFKVLETITNYALVDARIHTGRTHQIRVHLQHLGTPVLGDDVYGKPSSLIDRQALHAHSLEVQHPITLEMLKIVCDLPEDMHSAWLALGGLPIRL